MRKKVIWGYFVRQDDPWLQLAEVVRRFDLTAIAQPFTRCMTCNGLLGAVDTSDIEDRLEPNTRRYFDRFWQCQSCEKVYWKGTHYARLEARLRMLMG